MRFVQNILGSLNLTFKYIYIYTLWMNIWNHNEHNSFLWIAYMFRISMGIYLGIFISLCVIWSQYVYNAYLETYICTLKIILWVFFVHDIKKHIWVHLTFIYIYMFTYMRFIFLNIYIYINLFIFTSDIYIYIHSIFLCI